ncbi:MAG: GNAT family N-acetyltransferase [Thermomicrobiales bacterium]
MTESPAARSIPATPEAPTPPTQLLMQRPDLDGDPLATLPAGYELRLATPDDEEALAVLLSAAFAELGEWTAATVRERLTQAADVDAVYVIAFAGTPVATASSRHDHERFPGTGYVHWVGVSPEHRGQNLGSALMDQMLVDFRARGYRDAVLETDDFRLPAIRTYLKHGYVPVPENVKGEDHRWRWSAVLPQVLSPRGA